MDISPLSAYSATLAPTLPAAGTKDQQAEAVLSSDFETFLQMLTAQAKYQDPLEPIDSSEYAAQLAQFSMVEQQVLSNDLLTALTAQLGAGNMAQMASWIGMEARTSAPVQFDGAPITVLPEPSRTADAAFLVVRDAAGADVHRQQIAVSSEPVDWTGLRGDGTPIPSGRYSFAVESHANGDVIATTAADTYATVTEARKTDGDTLLILAGGSPVRASEISALRGAGY
ncbi:flagellar hook capping FlgD N-terminal domain-containing protein [Sulfitobacter sabulilitoris]|uniref:Basal-body rod modification protein FlgD n=1 Tax=Sulfitobacter sabulilitoris TaxID=2562655 RepID=A0A5S3PEN8_9RHOB|nr:flagellar hook capping FlgD N-terminal domain-containing protein [Sulfitobacter sabulilitoris]TMM52520.1 flagellar biosynthesis protein FlgD [Sulfitobacter sabulilitoris]